MSINHVADLQQACADGELWKLWYTSVPEPKTTEAYVAKALSGQQDGAMLPFVVRHNQTGAVIGSTRFCNIDSIYRRVEIGYTWYAKSYQRTPVNTECKLLLLQHAFETLEVIAVEFRTHWAQPRLASGHCPAGCQAGWRVKKSSGVAPMAVTGTRWCFRL